MNFKLNWIQYFKFALIFNIVAGLFTLWTFTVFDNKNWQASCWYFLWVDLGYISLILWLKELFYKTASYLFTAFSTFYSFYISHLHGACKIFWIFLHFIWAFQWSCLFKVWQLFLKFSLFNVTYKERTRQAGFLQGLPHMFLQNFLFAGEQS